MVFLITATWVAHRVGSYKGRSRFIGRPQGGLLQRQITVYRSPTGWAPTKANHGLSVAHRVGSYKDRSRFIGRPQGELLQRQITVYRSPTGWAPTKTDHGLSVAHRVSSYKGRSRFIGRPQGELLQRLITVYRSPTGWAPTKADHGFFVGAHPVGDRRAAVQRNLSLTVSMPAPTLRSTWMCKCRECTDSQERPRLELPYVPRDNPAR